MDESQSSDYESSRKVEEVEDEEIKLRLAEERATELVRLRKIEQDKKEAVEFMLSLGISEVR